MAFLIGGANTLDDGAYEITNSLRFNDDDSPSLAVNLSSPNTDKFTISFWIKLTGARSYVASLGKRLTGEAGDDASINIDQGGNGRLGISAYNGVADSNVAAYNSNTGQGALLRDVSAWYNLIYAFDTGQGTAGNRLKWYVNGVLQSGYNTTTTPAEDADLFPSSGSMFRIGKALSVETRFADCYLADYYYVDGQQYDHTYFGKTDDNGVWVPVKNGTGAGGAITFGTNGFHLEFKQTGTSANASGMGADTSGNDNHLTPTNLAAIDVTVDTPTNNFAILNALIVPSEDDAPTLSEGNCRVVTANAGSFGGLATIGVSSGKWYAEFKYITASDDVRAVVAVARDLNPFNTSDTSLGEDANSISYRAVDGKSYNNNSVASYGDTWAANDIIGVALDLDNLKLYFSKNGTWQNSGDPESGSTGTGALTASLSAGEFHFIGCGDVTGSYSETIEANYGNPPFSISSGNADANGYGNFEYAPPSGYYSLCTKNLAEYG
jgi:nitrogen fixation protein